MDLKSINREFYRRHNLELERYLFSNSSLHIINKNSKTKIDENYSEKLYFDTSSDIDSQIENIEKKFDVIVVTDVLEIYSDIYLFLEKLNNLLEDNGKLILSSVNTRWGNLLKIAELLGLKSKTNNFSYIHLNKIEKISNGAGYDLIETITRQFIPFKFLYLGNIINKILELLLFYFKFGVKTYIVLRKISIREKSLSKTIIIPAKNEEGNLEELVSRIPKFENCEIIFSIGESSDRTLEVSKKIIDKNSDFNIKLIEQSKNGKANAVWEAIALSSGDVLAILDSDLSVDPETLKDFFKIIESNSADFVNGTRLVYEMEKGSMRIINKLGNRVFQYLIGKIINEDLTDSLCGTKVFKKDLIKKIFWWQDNFNLKDPFGDFDLIFAASYTGQKILEYPIHYRTRKYGTTQISRFRDGFKLVKYLSKSFIVFNSSR